MPQKWDNHRIRQFLEVKTVLVEMQDSLEDLKIKSRKIRRKDKKIRESIQEF